MKTKFKAFLTAALAAAVLLTGCSSSNNTDNSITETTNSEVQRDDNGVIVLASGYIGDTSNGGKEQDVEWKLYRVDENDKTDKNCYLEVEGKGRMKDFTKEGEGIAPFHQYKDKIGRIRVWRGVSYIGEYAFSGCDNAFTAIIDDVTQIGKYAFEGCRNLSQVNLSDNMQKIGDGAFQNCSGLQTVRSESDYVKTDDSTAGKGFDVISYSFPKTLTDIGEKVFDGCTALTLQVKQDSKAEEYAKQNNYKYKIVKLNKIQENKTDTQTKRPQA